MLNGNKITKIKIKMDLNLFKNLVHVDVIRVNVTDKDGETVVDAHVHTQLVASVVELLNKSDLSDSTQIWMTKAPECKDTQPVVKEFLTSVQSTRFPFISMTFQNDQYCIEEHCYYDAEVRQLSLCEVTDPKIFHHPVFQCGKFDKIFLSGNSHSCESMDTTVEAFKASGLPFKEIKPGVHTYIYI